jgi:GNAT superfamily N-acetyltransferase
MVFWKIYPLLNVIQTKLNRDIFKSQIFDRDFVKSPTGLEAIVIRPSLTNTSILSEIRQFIKNNFGSPPTSPILDIPESQLLGKKDNIVIVRDLNGNIAGCIRYHYLGEFIKQNQEIYCVDCFTIYKSWRRKGVGDYLLTFLHNYANTHNMPYAMFLKEGSPLSIVHMPLYTGIYVFRELQLSKTPNVRVLTPALAYKLMDISSELNQILIIRNINSTNQIWKLYEKGIYKVLVCFQDAYQSFEAKRPEAKRPEAKRPEAKRPEANGQLKKICWATGWIESPNMTDEYREEASRELSDSMYPAFDYVWMNKKWIGKGNNNSWKIDGLFNWYSYQWTSSISINNSYCIQN